MTASVYVVRDRCAIGIIEKEVLDGFAAYIKEHPRLDLGKEEFFWTKEEAEAFCRGLEYGVDERTGMAPYPLKDWEKPDSRFMRLIDRPDDLDTSRESANEMSSFLATNHDCIILCDYDDEADDAYVDILEKHKCYSVWEDETVEEED